MSGASWPFIYFEYSIASFEFMHLKRCQDSRLFASVYLLDIFSVELQRGYLLFSKFKWKLKGYPVTTSHVGFFHLDTNNIEIWENIFDYPYVFRNYQAKAQFAPTGRRLV